MVRKLCLIENCQRQIMREVCRTGNDKAEEKYKDLQENKRRSSGSGGQLAFTPALSYQLVVLFLLHFSGRSPSNHFYDGNSYTFFFLQEFWKATQTKNTLFLGGGDCFTIFRVD